MVGLAVRKVEDQVVGVDFVGHRLLAVAAAASGILV